jgi:hypothetical protein
VLIHGACHCGNQRFELQWCPEPALIQARACGCSFCVKHGGVWTSWPAGSLVVSVRDAALVHRYEFGTRTAQFHVCRACGVVPVVTSAIAGQLYAVVNVNAFEGVDRERIRVHAAAFDTEDEATRLARRARYWIARVELRAAG